MRAIALVFVPDVDAATTRAVELGGFLLDSPTDMPWCLRQSIVSDSAGLSRALALRGVGLQDHRSVPSRRGVHNGDEFGERADGGVASCVDEGEFRHRVSGVTYGRRAVATG